MTYGNATLETREALAYLGAGTIIDDPDYPETETADVSVIIGGALDEEFTISRDLAREVGRTLFVFLTQRYVSETVEILVNVGHEDDRTEIFRASTIDAESRLRERGMWEDAD